MSRIGRKLVPSATIQHRMNLKDARVQARLDAIERRLAQIERTHRTRIELKDFEIGRLKRQLEAARRPTATATKRPTRRRSA